MKQLLFLRIYRGSELVLVKQVEEPPVILGRTGEATVRLDGDGISPIHAMIEEREGKYFLCDLGSETGTFKNDESILDDEIKSGDEIRIGPFRAEFFIGLPKPKAPPPAAKEIKSETPAPAKFTPPPKPSELQADKPAEKPVEKVAEKIPEKPVEKPVEKPAAAAAPPKPKAEEIKPKKPAKPEPDVDDDVVPETKGLPQAPAIVAKKDESKPTRASKPQPASGANVDGKIIKPVREAKQTFAPPSDIKDISKVIKPGKGSVVELMVVWGERILSTHHFDKAGVVNIGSHPDNEIILPVFGSPHIKHPLVKIDSFVTVFVSDSMTGEHYYENTKTPLRDYIREKRLATIGGGFAIPLQQGEMLRVDFGRGLSIYIRYTADTPKPLPPPFFMLSTSEFAGVIATFVIGSVLGLYMAVYSPEVKEPDETEAKRVAVFQYQKEPERVEVKMDELAGLPELPKDKPTQDALKGAASEAKPNESKSQEKKLTADKAGPDKGITKGVGAKTPTKVETKPVAAAAPKPKDVTKEGLLSVFGKSGTQAALRKTSEGSGSLTGAAAEATGAAAQGAGNAPGLGMKDIGAGGQGTATVGIAGVKTKGKGGGLSGYGTGTLGDKDRASVDVGGGAGEQFTGNIDKEGIRRVIIANQRQIKDCYERGLNRDPSLHGKVVLEWEIGDRGRVLSAKVKTSTLGSPVVENCMVQRLKTWIFPEPPGDQVAVVAYPFVFLMQQ
ncbi:MAG TPA: AgmX/PglI C-terminal domain-containing protein [Bdellovibrionales bacterium]|nr:AgmX/PglI C-terminal domain-containing protein [Bdellovibrionales bacterium]